MTLFPLSGANVRNFPGYATGPFISISSDIFAESRPSPFRLYNSFGLRAQGLEKNPGQVQIRSHLDLLDLLSRVLLHDNDKLLGFWIQLPIDKLPELRAKSWILL